MRMQSEVTATFQRSLINTRSDELYTATQHRVLPGLVRGIYTPSVRNLEIQLIPRKFARYAPSICLAEIRVTPESA